MIRHAVFLDRTISPSPSGCLPSRCLLWPEACARMKLVLHIGMNKTGSSALQRYFAGNRAELARRGLLYPRAGCGEGAGGRQHFALAGSLGFAPTPGAVDDGDVARIRRLIDEEIAACRPHTVVLSSEVFVRRGSVERVRRFTDGFDVRVLVYLRRHDHWWSSLYSQSVKMVVDPPWEPNFRSYHAHTLRRGRLHVDYAAFLRQWGEVFGNENLIVRPYERAQIGDVAVDAMERIGHADLLAQVKPGEVRVNPSLSPVQVAVIDALQRTAMPRRRRRELIEAVAEAKCAGDAGSLVPRSMRRQLVEENRGSYAEIARTYLGRSDGTLFYEPDPEPGEDDSAPDPAAIPAAVRLLLQAIKAA